MFIDLHTHILPTVDDGAESFSEAFELIEQAYENGTRAIALTPHFNNPWRGNAKVGREDIISRYKLIKNELLKTKIPISIYLGCELLGGEDIHSVIKSGAIIPLNGSKYVLLEFLFPEKKNIVLRNIDALFDAGYHPVIAHPERYDFLKSDPYAIKDLVNKNCILQVNKGSFFGEYGEYAMRYSRWLLENNLIHAIASDCHSVSGRNADMGEVYQMLTDVCERKYLLDIFYNNPKKILMNEEIDL